jgi:CubicO group peptidase (beta-lactamase class C family)
MFNRKLALIAVLMSVGLSASAAQILDTGKLETEIATLFAAKSVDNTSPGCAIGVIQDGQWALRRSYGMANLEHDVPITNQSIFRMGSVSKQFTAMAIALLAQQGKIDLDADIHMYLPDLPDYGHKVTTRQMIHHISGIPDYEEGIPALKTADGRDLRLGNQDYLSIPKFYEMAKKIPLFAPPETEFAYSNTAYFLLSQLVKAVSGQSLRTYAQDNIFSPLGMEDSFFNDEVNDVVKNRVDGYTRNEDGSYVIFMTNLSWVGDGGLYTNLDDMLEWDQNFYDNRLGNPEIDLVAQLEQPYSVSEGYAWAQNVGTYRGLREVSHTGSWVAFTTYYVRYSERQISIIALCNSNVITASVGYEVRDLVLDQITDTPRP